MTSSNFSLRYKPCPRNDTIFPKFGRPDLQGLYRDPAAWRRKQCNPFCRDNLPAAGFLQARPYIRVPESHPDYAEAAAEKMAHRYSWVCFRLEYNAYYTLVRRAADPAPEIDS